MSHFGTASAPLETHGVIAHRETPFIKESFDPIA